MSLTPESLQNFKQHLLSKRQVLTQELQAATSEWLEEDPYYSDTIDQANADVDRSIGVQIKNRDRIALVQINQALNRIEAGSFGVCDECDESIAEARMQVNPATTLCIDCQAELESEQSRYPGRV